MTAPVTAPAVPRRGLRWWQWTLLVLALLAVTGGTAVAGCTYVTFVRPQQRLDRALDDLGTPPGFRRVGSGVTGNAVCLDTCLEITRRFTSTLAHPAARAVVQAHLTAKGAGLACSRTSPACRPGPITDAVCARAAQITRVCSFTVERGGRFIAVLISDGDASFTAGTYLLP